jgi:hypothetical protein
MDTAIVITKLSVMNSGRSVLACMNFESRSGGCVAVFVFGGSVEGRIVVVGGEDLEEGGKRSAMRSWANFATAKVESRRPYFERRR